MNVSRELKKLRLFLFTPAPYLAGVFGICMTLAALSISPVSSFVYLQTQGEIGHQAEKGEKFDFSFHCSRGTNSLDVIRDTGKSFIHVSTLPAKVTTEAVMAINLKANPGVTLQRYNRTYVLLFGYLNFYVFIFSRHSQSIRCTGKKLTASHKRDRSESSLVRTTAGRGSLADISINACR